MLMLARTLIRRRTGGAVGQAKSFFTATYNATSSNIPAIGLGDNSISLTNVNIGTGATGWCIKASGGNWAFQNNGGGASTGIAIANGAVIGLAYDSIAGAIYISVNGTYYQSSGASTGTSPTIPSFTGVSGILFPICVMNCNGVDTPSFTLNPSPASPPAGYLGWGGTWNPADKAPNCTLSGGDLIATNATGSTNNGARGTISH